MPSTKCETCALRETPEENPGAGTHLERFGVLEADVQGLKRSYESLEHKVDEGFGRIYDEIKNMGRDWAASTERRDRDITAALERKDTLRSSAVVSSIGYIVGIVILTATLIYQNVSGVSSAVSEARQAASAGITRAESNLAMFVAHYETQHKELDDRLQKEQGKSSENIKSEIATLDGKVKAEMALGAKLDNDRILELAAELKDLRAKWDRHIEETAEFRGRVGGHQSMNEDRIKVLEEAQSRYGASYTEFRGEVNASLESITHRINMLSDRFWGDRTTKLQTYESQDVQDLNGLRKNVTSPSPKPRTEAKP